MTLHVRQDESLSPRALTGGLLLLDHDDEGGACVAGDRVGFRDADAHGADRAVAHAKVSRIDDTAAPTVVGQEVCVNTAGAAATTGTSTRKKLMLLDDDDEHI